MGFALSEVSISNLSVLEPAARSQQQAPVDIITVWMETKTPSLRGDL